MGRGGARDEHGSGSSGPPRLRKVTCHRCNGPDADMTGPAAGIGGCEARTCRARPGPRSAPGQARSATVGLTLHPAERFRVAAGGQSSCLPGHGSAMQGAAPAASRPDQAPNPSPRRPPPTRRRVGDAPARVAGRPTRRRSVNTPPRSCSSASTHHHLQSGKRVGAARVAEPVKRGAVHGSPLAWHSRLQRTARYDLGTLSFLRTRAAATRTVSTPRVAAGRTSSRSSTAKTCGRP